MLADHLFFVSHQFKKGSTVDFIYGTTEHESAYSSKLDTSPKLFTVGI